MSHVLSYGMKGKTAAKTFSAGYFSSRGCSVLFAMLKEMTLCTPHEHLRTPAPL